MTELSPSAQVVFDSYKAASDGWLQYESCQIAAALRAAALYCKRDALILLSLADELEAQQSIPLTTMTNYKQLCAELANELDHNRQCLLDDRRLTHPLADKARAALAEPESKTATKAELDKFVEEYWGSMKGFYPGGHETIYTPFELIAREHFANFARDVLARWGNHPGSPDSSLQPISVSERLPGPEDCDREGNAWAWRRFDPEGGIDNGDFWCLASCEWLGDEDSGFTHWLPAHALPVPS